LAQFRAVCPGWQATLSIVRFVAQMRGHGWWLVAAGITSACLLLVIRQRRRSRLQRPRKKPANKINIGGEDRSAMQWTLHWNEVKEKG
jgi:hypothetical protein